MKIRAKADLRYSAVARYAIAVFTGISAVLVTRALRTIIPSLPADLIYCATIFSAWFGGTGPGLLAAAISSAAIAFQFIPPPSPGAASTSELLRTLVITLGVFFVSWISGGQRRAEIQLQRARDELEERVRERTAELQRSNDALQAEMAERKSVQEALLAMRAELAHVSRVTMMGELTASIAHEVNQPLGAIMNYANACRRLLASSGDFPDVDEALAKIVEDARRASDVIAGIRELVRKGPMERSSARIKDIIEQVVVILDSEARARGAKVKIDSAPDLPALRVDRVQIQQVLLNLIINGIEAMESLAPADRRIDITISSERSEGAGAVIVRVRDHGTGVKPEDEPRLFSAFYSTKPRGLGMGLCISRSIVEAHGGRLSLVPSAGAGATFQMVLPILNGTPV